MVAPALAAAVVKNPELVENVTKLATNLPGLPGAPVKEEPNFFKTIFSPGPFPPENMIDIVVAKNFLPRTVRSIILSILVFLYFSSFKSILFMLPFLFFIIILFLTYIFEPPTILPRIIFSLKNLIKRYGLYLKDRQEYNKNNDKNNHKNNDKK